MKLFPLIGLAAMLFAAPHAHAQSTIEAVRKAGVLNCGLVSDEDDYSEADTHGNLSVLGADYCRALSAEIFGNKNRARFLVLPDEPTALARLRDRKVDVVFGATPDPAIGSVYQVAFGPPMLLDGQGFLVSDRSGISRLADLSGKRVCFINASPAERTLYDALDSQLRTPELHFPYSERGEMNVAMLDGHCDAITGDLSAMAGVRAGFGANAARFHLLGETISTDPFSPAVRQGDAQWAALVDWTIWVPLQAEAHGIDHANLAGSGNNADPVLQRLSGRSPWIGRTLGIGEDGFTHALQQVGNAAEIFDRDAGARSPLALPRGRSAPLEKGGALWSLPVAPLQ